MVNSIIVITANQVQGRIYDRILLMKMKWCCKSEGAIPTFSAIPAVLNLVTSHLLISSRAVCTICSCHSSVGVFGSGIHSSVKGIAINNPHCLGKMWSASPEFDGS